MSDLNIPPAPLPTLDRLGVSPSSIAPDLDVKKVAQTWLKALSNAVSTNNISSIINNLVLPDAFWRDMLALTWDLRTFSGKDKIRTFLTDRLALSQLHNFTLREEYTALQKPFPDLLWISLMFDFENDVGRASGVARLVPTTDNGDWKAHVVFTNLDSLRDFPEKTGLLRDFQLSHGVWEEQRRKQTAFEGREDPKVLIIGAGQSGLEMGARLKMLGVDSLIVDKSERVGDTWRKRYDALSLHDPVWYGHMPYLPFPPNWPVYSPAKKLANWLEFYAEAMELDIWLSSNVAQVIQDPQSNKWHVTIQRKGHEDRKFVVNHIVFCTGFSGVKPNFPIYPGMEKFKGEILHSTQYGRASDYEGKKVAVIGACTSAHDISQDCHEHGVDITMFQRSSTYIMSTENGWSVILKGTYWEGSPPADVMDRMYASFPNFATVEWNQRATGIIAHLDRNLIEGLHKVGFRTNLGPFDSGVTLLVWSKVGGYYLDTGASKLIAEGKIKLKTDSEISSFTDTGIKFENGTELAADVVIFSTGLGNPIEHIESVCGEEVAKKCKPLRGLDAEGELNGAWKNLGVPGLWYMMGNLALCRFHSTHLALQIKAIEEGILSSRYELQGTA